MRNGADLKIVVITAVVVAATVLIGTLGIVTLEGMRSAESDMRLLAVSLLPAGEASRLPDDAARIHERSASLTVMGRAMMVGLVCLGVAAFLCVMALTFAPHSAMRKAAVKDVLDAKFERY